MCSTSHLQNDACFNKVLRGWNLPYAIDYTAALRTHKWFGFYNEVLHIEH